MLHVHEVFPLDLFRNHAETFDGTALCRMFHHAISGRGAMPKYLSSDNDPLFLFERWKANLRILDAAEIKTAPYVLLSHPFVERLIGTVRREYLDQIMFWTRSDLENKLLDFQNYYNNHRTHSSLEGRTPNRETKDSQPFADLHSYRWQSRCRGLYQTPIAT
jgi:putative transposase